MPRCRELLPGALLAALLVLASSRVDARPASSGFYAEAGLGATSFLGPNSEYAQIGPSMDLRMGYDLFSWFSVGVHIGGSTHEATVPPPPEGEYFQLYTAHGEGRLGFLYKSVAVFVDGGVGLSMISSNVLEKVRILDPGEQFTLSFSAGGGIEYQLVNRHYAVGLAGQWMLLPEFDAMSNVTVRAYLRYTY